MRKEGGGRTGCCGCRPFVKGQNKAKLSVHGKIPLNSNSTILTFMQDILYRYNPWWTEEYGASGMERKKYLDPLFGMRNKRDVVLITGLRRVGKTYLMFQLVEKLLGEVEKERIFYVSLDNIALRNENILDIVEEYRRIHSLRHRDFVYLFLDEVHTKEDYELQLKNIYDMGNAKIYASGSASLDIIMKSPHLTGRQRLIRVSPLDFNEYIEFTGKKLTPEDAHLYPSLAEEYTLTGGIPEYVETGDLNYLQSLLDTVIYRDIGGRHNIRNTDKLVDIISFLAQSVGTPLSLRKISRMTGISKDGVNEVLSLFTEANFIHPVEREGKLSERKTAPRKFYLEDTGFFSVLTENINLGPMIENSVYLKLLEQGDVRYYRSSGKEVDFVRKGKAWESKYKDNIEDKDIESLRGLKRYDKKLITKTKKEKIHGITSLPLWEFLMHHS